MSGLDWFALCTGLIGLAADLVTIGSLARSDGSYHMAPTTVWVIVPILIIYTTIILSFYTRRIALVRHYSVLTISLQGSSDRINIFDRINKGGRAIAFAIGAPLQLLYGVCIFISFGDRADMGNFSILMVVFGIPVALAVSGIFSWIAGILYAAFDPRYGV